MDKIIGVDFAVEGGDKTTQKAGKETKTQKPLNAKQERFCYEYVRTNEAKQAAINSGYKADHAKERGYSLLQDPRIRSLIDTEKAKLHKSLLKDRSVFLREVEELKQTCKENKRIGELIKLLTLEASVLGIDKRDVSVQTTNIFNTMDTAKAFLNGFKDTIDVEGSVDTNNSLSGQEGGKERNQSIEETANTTTQIDATHMSGTTSTLSGEVIDIPFETGGGGQG